MGNYKKTYTIVFYSLLACIITLLSGCAMYPSLDKSSGIKIADSKGPVDCYKTYQNHDQDLELAKECLFASLEELDTLLANVGYTERTFAYTAVGAGAFSAFRVAKKSSNPAPLENTVIGLASLIGLRAAVDPSRQQQILLAGITAHQCILDSAYAIEHAAVVMNKSNTQMLYNSIISGTELQPQINAMQGYEKLVPVMRYSIGNILQAQNDFKAMTTSAESSLPETLRSSVIILRSRIRGLLSSYTADIQTIYDAQRSRVNEMLDSMVEKGKQDRQDVQTLKSLFNITGNALFTESVTSTADAVKPANEVLARCVTGIDSLK